MGKKKLIGLLRNNLNAEYNILLISLVGTLTDFIATHKDKEKLTKKFDIPIPKIPIKPTAKFCQEISKLK